MKTINVNGEEIDFPDSMSDKDIEKALQKLYPPKRSAKDAAKMAIGDVAAGVPTIPLMIADLGYGGLGAITGEPNTDYPSARYKRMVDKAFPQPITGKEKLISSTVRGAAAFPIGPLGLISGATSGAASEATAQAGFPVGAQIAAGIAGGVGPSVVASGLKSVAKSGARTIRDAIGKPSVGQTVSSISPEANLADAMAPSVAKYTKMVADENAAWDAARSAISDKSFNAVKGIKKDIVTAIESRLRDLGYSLTNASASQVKEILDTVFRGRKIKVSDLLNARKNISDLASSSLDGTTKKIAGTAYRAIDDYLSNIEKTISDSASKLEYKFNPNKVYGGDINSARATIAEVTPAAKEAIAKSRQKFAAFGTEKGQSSKFEKFFKSKDRSMTSVAAVMGQNARITPAKEEFITRAIQQSGEAGKNAKTAFANFFYNNAIQKSTEVINGSKFINPKTMRVELDKILSAQSTNGGIGKLVRDVVFDKEDLLNMAELYRKLPKEGGGSIAYELFTRLPVVKHFTRYADTPNLAAKKAATDIVETTLPKSSYDKILRPKVKPKFPKMALPGAAIGGSIPKKD